MCLLWLNLWFRWDWVSGVVQATKRETRKVLHCLFSNAVVVCVLVYGVGKQGKCPTGSDTVTQAINAVNTYTLRHKFITVSLQKVVYSNIIALQ